MPGCDRAVGHRWRSSHDGAAGAVTLLVLGLCDQARAEDLSKEGTFRLRLAWSGSVEALIPAGRDAQAFVYQFLGVATNQAGEGFLHNASMRCIGFGHAQDGAEQNHGNCVYTDPDGHRMFADWQDEGTAQKAEGSGNLLGGTGKYQGITGSYGYARIALPRAAAGTFQGYTVDLEGSFELP